MFAIGILFFMGYSLQMYYFILNDECIVIKNYYIPWEFEEIYYNEINEFRIDKTYKLPYCLTIIKIAEQKILIRQTLYQKSIGLGYPKWLKQKD